MIPHPADSNIYCDGVDDKEDWDSLIYGKFPVQNEIYSMMIFETHNDEDDLQLPANIVAEEQNRLIEQMEINRQRADYRFYSGGAW